MNKDEVTYEQPHGWMQQLVSETDGKKTIRYTFTKTRIGKNDIPIYFQETLEQPAPKNCTPLDEYIAEMEKDPEIKQLLDIAREDVKKWLTQPAQEPVGDAHYYCSTIERCLDDLPDEYLKLHRNFLKDVAQTIRNTHPTPSWQGLSDDVVASIWMHEAVPMNGQDFKRVYRAIEQALKEKNT